MRYTLTTMKSVHLSKKHITTVQVVSALLGVILVAYIYQCGIQKVCNVVSLERIVRPGKELAVPKGSIWVEVVNTHASREKGLSGRTGLGENEGMLFVFENSGRYGFWMKDMLFAIDILWINKEGVVVHVERNVTPDSYFNTTPPQTFINTPEALYVLELATGSAEKHGLYLGTKVGIGE